MNVWFELTLRSTWHPRPGVQEAPDTRMHACMQTGKPETLTDGEQLEPQHVVDAHLGDDRGIQVRVLHTQDTHHRASVALADSHLQGQLPGEGSPVSPG